MPLIRFVQGVSAAVGGVERVPGDEVFFEDRAEAQRWIQEGVAIGVSEDLNDPGQNDPKVDSGGHDPDGNNLSERR